MKPEFDSNVGTLAISQKVVEILKPLFEGTENQIDRVGTVARYHKRFNSKEDVKKNVTNRGCIQIAALNVKNVRRDAGHTVGTIQFIAFVMADDHYGKNRAQRAEVIAGRLGLEVLKPAFTKQLGETAHKQVSQSTWQSLTNQSFDDVGVAIWAVEWQHECRLNTPPEMGSMDDFITCDMTLLQDGGVVDQEPVLHGDIKLEQKTK